MSTKTKRPCGNPKCKCSTGIHEGLTFGSGKLDDHGFWENPCRICAADCDSRIEETRASVRQERIDQNERLRKHVESLTPEQLEEYKKHNDMPLEAAEAARKADEYIRNAEWINLKAWPYS